ncbi:hypothetical protein PTKIN_Ptkin02bG0070700 [Pterospermum kingtungense]
MPHHTFSKLAQKLGPIIYLRLGQVPTIVISSAQLARLILKTHDHVFSNRPQLVSAQYLSFNCSDITRLTWEGGVGSDEGKKGHLAEVLTETQELFVGMGIGDFFPEWEWVHSVSGYKKRLMKNLEELRKVYDEIIEEHSGGIWKVTATLEWTMTELARHPEMMKRAQEEVRSIAHRTRKVGESHL